MDPAEVPVCWVEVSQPHAFVGHGSSSLLEVVHRRYLLPEIIQLQGLADVDFAEKFAVVGIPSVGGMYAQMEFVISTKSIVAAKGQNISTRDIILDPSSLLLSDSESWRSKSIIPE